MKAKRILFLGGPAHQIRSIKKAKEMGLYIGLVDMNPEAPARAYADEFFQCSLIDQAKVLEVAKSFKPNGVTQGMVDRSISTCAYVAQELGLPGVGYETSIKASDKYAMLKAFEEHKVPHPQYEYIASDKIAEATNTKLEYPIIIKPVDMQGSRGVFLAYNEQELQEMALKSSAIGLSGDLLLEELLQGPEFSVEFLVLKGKAKVIQITGKIGYDAPYFVGTGVLQPARISEADWQGICRLIEQAAEAVGLINSMGNADVMLTAEGPKMIELAPRQGGCGVGEELLELSSGVDFTDIAIKVAMGEEVPLPENELHRASCIKYLLSEKGVIESINGVEEAQNSPNIVEVKVLAKKGDTFNGSMNKESRIIAVIGEGCNADEAEAACDKAIKTISIIYK